LYTSYQKSILMIISLRKSKMKIMMHQVILASIIMKYLNSLYLLHILKGQSVISDHAISFWNNCSYSSCKQRYSIVTMTCNSLQFFQKKRKQSGTGCGGCRMRVYEM